MKQQAPALELIKGLKEELHGKLEHSVELRVDQLIAQIERELEHEVPAGRTQNYRIHLMTVLGLLVRYLPEIKRFFDER